MNPNNRHVACKLCRDRKVRCDGTQPSCDKCRQSGEDCIYLPIQQRPTKADLNQMIETLQKRLGEAEARISSFDNSTANDHISNGHRGSNFQRPTSPVWNGNVEQAEPSAFLCPLPPFQPTTSVNNVATTGIMSNPMLSYHRHLHHSPEAANGELMETLPSNGSGGTMDRGDLLLQGDGDELDRLDIDLPPSRGTGSSRLQGSRDQAMAFVDTSTASSSISNSAGFPYWGGSSGGTGNSSYAESMVAPSDNEKSNSDASQATLKAITDFMTAIFQSQTEISGLALVSAEYLAWMRKAPTAVGSKTSLVYTNVLETIEERLRELREIAETRHQAAFRELVGVLQGTEQCGRVFAKGLLNHEKILQHRSEETMKYFETKYNACALLSEQTQGLPHGQPLRSMRDASRAIRDNL